MEGIKKKWKKYLTWTRNGAGSDENPMARKSRSWSSSRGAKNRRPAAPDGCFPVYVGAERQRFVVKTKVANHPLFQMLLEDAEMEYGYDNQGPISLPCDVELFHRVLAAMDGGDEVADHWGAGDGGYAAALVACSPLRLRSCGGGHGYGGGYRLLGPSPMLKLNHQPYVES